MTPVSNSEGSIDARLCERRKACATSASDVFATRGRDDEPLMTPSSAV
jgi:hypothetical protein